MSQRQEKRQHPLLPAEGQGHRTLALAPHVRTDLLLLEVPASLLDELLLTNRTDQQSW